MYSKTNKEDRSCDEIAFLSEITEEFSKLNSVKLGKLRAYHQFSWDLDYLNIPVVPCKLIFLRNSNAKMMIFRSAY